MSSSCRSVFLFICLAARFSAGLTGAFVINAFRPATRQPCSESIAHDLCDDRERRRHSGSIASLSPSSHGRFLSSLRVNNTRREGCGYCPRDDKQNDDGRGKKSGVAVPPRGALCILTRIVASATETASFRSLRQIAAGLRQVLPPLLLALWIWQRSLAGGGNRAWATQERGDPVSVVASRPARLWTRIVRRSGKAEPSSAPVVGGPSATEVAVAHSGDGGRDSISSSSTSPSPSSLVASVPAPTTSVVATLATAAATVAVVRRVSTDEAQRQRLAENQKRIRDAFQSNLKRMLRHEPEEDDDDDDDPIMTKRFRFLRAKYGSDESIGAEDGGVEGASSYDTADFEEDRRGSTTSTAILREDHRQLKQLRKKSEQEYVKALLNRVKQSNGGVPSMRRTPRPPADSPESASLGKDNSAVQNLKSISSISPSFEVNDDLAVSASGGSPNTTSTPLDLRSTGAGLAPLHDPAVVTPGNEMESTGTAPPEFLHELDQAFVLAFGEESQVCEEAPASLPRAATTPVDAPSRHEVDEAYARAFESSPWIGTRVDSEQDHREASPVAFTSSKYQHDLDEAYAEVFNQQALSRSEPSPEPELEQPDVAQEAFGSDVGVQDLALIGGEITSSLWADENTELRISDVAFEVFSNGLSLTDHSDLDEVSGSAHDSAIPGSVAPAVDVPVARQIKVIESLESLVESENAGVAKAAADVLAEVDAASDLTDRLKAARQTIDTTATLVDDVRDESGSDASQVVKTDGRVNAVVAPVGDQEAETLLAETTSTSVLSGSAYREQSSLMKDSSDDTEINSEVSDPTAGVVIESDVPGTQSDAEPDHVADQSLSMATEIDAQLDSTAGLTTEDTLEEGTASLVASAELSPVDETGSGVRETAEVLTDILLVKKNAVSTGHSDLVPVDQGPPYFDEKTVDNSIAGVPHAEERRRDTPIGDAFPAWIRDRVRTKRQHQRDRSRSKKTLGTGQNYASPLAVEKVTPTAPSLPPKVDHDAVTDSEKTQSEVTSGSELPIILASLSKAEPANPIPSLSPGSKRQRQGRKRARPQRATPAEAEALSRKYAEIPSLEERAFVILKDLGMLEPSDDATP